MKAHFRIETLPLPQAESTDSFAAEVLEGLTGHPRRLSSRYFYDARGSELFQKITTLPEYYLTRCEREILTKQRVRLVGLVREHLSESAHERLNVVELGSGDGHKAFLVLEQLRAEELPFEYVPIDISVDAMHTLMASLAASLPDVQAHGLISEYFTGLHWLSRTDHSLNLVMFLGSNIGNFQARECRSFLCRLWDSLSPGDLVLIGFDLKKDIPTLLRAYNDSQGVTREFNFNLLRRINRELEADFAIGEWEHYAPYNPNLGAMESYLVSRKRQKVRIGRLRRSFEFDRAEPIHTEYSCKYSLRDIQDLAQDNGFELVTNLIDDRGWFADSLWRVVK